MSAVFLPVFLAVSLHQHGTVSDILCNGCSQNIPHSHFNQNTDLCLVCQFLSATWLISSEEEYHSPVPDSVLLDEAVVTFTLYAVVERLSTRAPPVFFC